MRKGDSKPRVEGPPEKLLLVEGPDDIFTLQEIFVVHRFVQKRERPQLPEGVFRMEIGATSDQVSDSADAGGYEHLRNSLDARLSESGLARLGIVTDADDDIEARWQSLRTAFTELGYLAVPERWDAAGTVFGQDGKPTIGIWLMPDNANRGALEDLAWSLIGEEHPLRGYASEVVDGIPEYPKSTDKNFENWKSKARIHSWLAWQEEPGKPMGQAIIKRFLDPRAEGAQRFIAWVRRLFELPAG